MKKIKTLQCISCGKEHDQDEVKYLCSSCGGNLHVMYDYNLIKKRFSYDELNKNRHMDMWRYLDLLPLSDLSAISCLQIGYTPLYKYKSLAEEFSVAEFYVKDDGRNPSASFKDRASAVVLAKAMESGQKVICSASTGNAASSLACLSSNMDIKTVIFVPQKAPAAKIAQLLVFGATVVTVNGTYDDAFDLSVKASEEFGWYNRNTGYNPYSREGKKTCAFEICEQLEWETPDYIFVPVGDGNIISGIWKGFLEFKKIGFIEKLPKLVAVQAENSNAIKLAFESDTVIRPVAGHTVADSISVSLPRDGQSAVMALKESGGFVVSVCDKEILKAISHFARKTGVFAEPAAAAGYAGFLKAVKEGKLDKKDSVLIVVTGNGLKDVQSAMKSVGKPYFIEPQLSALKNIVADFGLEK